MVALGILRKPAFLHKNWKLVHKRKLKIFTPFKGLRLIFNAEKCYYSKNTSFSVLELKQNSYSPTSIHKKVTSDKCFRKKLWYGNIACKPRNYR